MDFNNTRIRVLNFLSSISRDTIVSSILSDLHSSPRNISSIYLYDSKGSELFKKITQLPEYYLSRLESELIKKYALEHGDCLYETDIIELGSGDCSKISLLLEAVCNRQTDSIRYVPFDVSIDALLESAQILVNRFPRLLVDCIVGDFISQLDTISADKKKLFCFFGSTIGNLAQTQRLNFYKNISSLMNSGDILLLGVDMVKEKIPLESAYNDSQQVTSMFNRNILNVVNTLTGTDFRTDGFEHLAFFNQDSARIEMHLRASHTMTIHCPVSTDIVIKEGETIHTENSYKFTYNQVENEIKSANMRISSSLTDSKHWFFLFEIIKDSL